MDRKQHPNLGKKLSDEQKMNLSEKAKERFINSSNHPMYGKHHTEEAKQKMSDSRKGVIGGSVEEYIV